MRRALWLAVLCFPFSVLLAQPGRFIVLENADSLIGRVIGGENARELIGNVRFRQENVQVSCDRAIQYLASGRVDLLGNVLVKDDSIHLRAPRGRYHKDERRAEAFDSVNLDDGNVVVTSGYGEYFVNDKRASFRTNVTVRDTGSVLIADSLVYMRTEKRTLAFNNVTVFNPADNISISGERFESLATENYSRMWDRPVLVQFDTAVSGKVDTFIVRARVMESHQVPTKRLVATDSVRIVRSDLSSVAGRATFYMDDDSITLRISPMVWYLQSQISGDSINVFLKKRKLDKVVVTGDAFALSRGDVRYPGRFDQMTGETLAMYFAGQQLDHIEVDVRATSIYHLYEDSAANGFNKTSGDRLRMKFEEGKVSSISVMGGVQGQYVPENLVRGKENEFTLAGFRWVEDRPFAQASDFARQRRGMPLPKSNGRFP